MTEKLTLLVVDDSRTVRASLRNSLKELFHIVEAEDGEAGWATLAADPRIELVISDISMPKLDGYGFICRIRSAGEDVVRKKPVIVITSAEDDASRERAYACGANDFVLKPLDSADLLSRVSFQIEASLSGRTHIADDMLRYESAIEAAVLEKPDLHKALEMLKSGDVGAIEPYLIDLCLEALPLFEHASRKGMLDIEHELSAIKQKLK